MDILARQFLSAVYGEITDPEEKKTAIQKLLEAAGFQVKSIQPGKEKAYERDQDGSRIGDGWQTNKSSGLIVKEENDFSNRATYWLEALWAEVSGKKHSEHFMSPIWESDEEKIAFIVAEVERSVPLEPIVISADQDILKEKPPFYGGLQDHTRDDTPVPHSSIDNVIGYHALCGGAMEMSQTSPKVSALYCKKCFLRVTLADPKTYGDIRKHFYKWN